MTFLKYFTRNATTLQEAAQKLREVNIVGKKLLCPLSLTATELKSLLWTALDLRYISTNKIGTLPSMKKTKVTLIMDHSDAYIQLPFKLGTNLIEASPNVVIDKAWKKNTPFVCDFGRLLSINSDIIFCRVGEQKNVVHIAEGATIPVVGISSNDFDTITTLAHFMTIYEHFTRLKYLTVGWIGKPTALLNCYMLLLPQFKINFKYFLVEGTSNSEFTSKGKIFSEYCCTQFQEVFDVEEAIYRSDVVSVTDHENCDCQITLDILQYAARNWIFLHNLPRMGSEVKCDVFNHKNSLVWKSMENMQYVYAAFIIRFLTCYKHYTQEPFFDSEEFTKKW